MSLPTNADHDGSALPPEGDEREPMLYCPVRSTRLAGRKCKLVCRTCGYYLSCADHY